MGIGEMKSLKVMWCLFYGDKNLILSLLDLARASPKGYVGQDSL